MNKWFEFKSDNDCKHAEGLYENCPFCRIESLKQELASYMESDANLRKRVEELEALRTANHELIADMEKDQKSLLLRIDRFCGVHDTKLRPDEVCPDCHLDMHKRIQQLEGDYVDDIDEPLFEIIDSVYKRRYSALEDGLRNMPRYRGVDGHLMLYSADVLALLDSINNPDSDSKVSTLIDQEND